MRIVVNHLTRMAPGFICVAGIDLDTDRHVRPRCNRAMLPLRWAGTYGGPFAIGNVVELGPARHIGQLPEIEDFVFHERVMHVLDRLEMGVFWKTLQAHCDSRLQRIFGPELQLNGRTCVTNQGEGRASLGCLVPSRIHDLFVSTRGTVRLRLDVGRASLDVPVTDLRFYQMNDTTAAWTVNWECVERVRLALQAGSPTILSVGLTRPFKRAQGDSPRHWLQVNNIHFEDDPRGLHF